jgi:maltose alpha-D-glucosyltransferase/alpha-amylase
VQHVELGLNEYAGWLMEELFGSTSLPTIQKGTYPLTLGPHGFYWFALIPSQTMEETVQPSRGQQLPVLDLSERWQEWVADYGQNEIEGILPNYLRRREIVPRGRDVIYVTILTTISFQIEKVEFSLLLLRVGFRTGLPETIPLMLTLITPEEEHLLLGQAEVIGLARVTGLQEGLLVTPLAIPRLATQLLKLIISGQRFAFDEGELIVTPTPALTLTTERISELVPLWRQSERHNLTVTYGSDYILKVFRRVEEGANPDWEVSRFLHEEQRFPHVAPIAGAITWQPEKGEVTTLAILHQYVPNQGTAWQFVVHGLGRFYEEIAATMRNEKDLSPLERASAGGTPRAALRIPHWFDAAPDDNLAEKEAYLASLLPTIQLLGKRTAEMHQALVAGHLPAFCAVPYAKPYQRSVYQAVRLVAGRLEERLERERGNLPEAAADLVDRYLKCQKQLMDRLDNLLFPIKGAMRTRIHGDYHLRQLLFTGNDFVIIDFEGQPNQTINERRIKRSPLRDVATMVRSFDYAAWSVLLGLATSAGHSHGLVREEDKALLQPWADWWAGCVSRALIQSYVQHMQSSGILPDQAGCRVMLDFYVLEKDLANIDYELTNRPNWLVIPLRNILRTLEN